MRTAAGGTPFDPLDLPSVEIRLRGARRWKLAYASRAEGTRIYELSAL